jgi:hypothetical protein
VGCVYNTIVFIVMLLVHKREIHMLCPTELAIFLYAKYEKHYQILFYSFDKNVTKYPEVLYSRKRQVFESTVLTMSCATLPAYIYLTNINCG